MSLWHRFVRFLTDDSSARENMREVAEILREVLQTSRGDGDFDTVLREVLEAREPGSSFYRLPRFKGFLAKEYRRKERPSDWFVIARHVLEDLPRIYGLPLDEPRQP